MKDDKFYLIHILEAIEKIQLYTANGKNEFMSTQLIQDAVIRNMQIIGEATKKLSDEFKNNNPDIPWRSMAGIRDVLVHDYFGVNLTIVWDVIENELPEIYDNIKRLA